jgi:putative intracellular protease/amidase
MAMTQIAIVVYPGFTALDFIGPYEVLRNLPDAEVRFVWHEAGPIAADSGVLLVGATHSFDETPSPDILLVPGGLSTFEHARDEKLLDWVRRADETSTWTTSVCSGSVILAAAGLLKGRRATSHWLVLPMLKPFGVDAVGDERIVHEGKFVTAAGVSAGIDLAMWLFGEICGEAKAKAVQLSIEYDPQPPFDSGHVSKASASTRAMATAQLSKETFKQHQVSSTVKLLWDAALQRARGGKKSRKRDRQAISA